MKLNWNNLTFFFILKKINWKRVIQSCVDCKKKCDDYKRASPNAHGMKSNWKRNIQVKSFNSRRKSRSSVGSNNSTRTKSVAAKISSVNSTKRPRNPSRIKSQRLSIGFLKPTRASLSRRHPHSSIKVQFLIYFRFQKCQCLFFSIQIPDDLEYLWG